MTVNLSVKVKPSEIWSRQDITVGQMSELQSCDLNSCDPLLSLHQFDVDLWLPSAAKDHKHDEQPNEAEFLFAPVPLVLS